MSATLDVPAPARGLTVHDQGMLLSRGLVLARRLAVGLILAAAFLWVTVDCLSTYSLWKMRKALASGSVDDVKILYSWTADSSFYDVYAEIRGRGESTLRIVSKFGYGDPPQVIKTTIPPEEIRDVLLAFDENGFLSMRRKRRWGVRLHDVGLLSLSLTIGGRKKTIELDGKHCVSDPDGFLKVLGAVHSLAEAFGQEFDHYPGSWAGSEDPLERLAIRAVTGAALLTLAVGLAVVSWYAVRTRQVARRTGHPGSSQRPDVRDEG